MHANTNRTIHLRLSEELQCTLDSASIRFGVPKAEIVRRALRKYSKTEDVVPALKNEGTTVPLKLKAMPEYLVADLSGDQMRGIVGWYIKLYEHVEVRKPFDYTTHEPYILGD